MRKGLWVLILLMSLELRRVICCPLEFPRVYFHYYRELKPIDVAAEKEEFRSLQDDFSSCVNSELPGCCLCSSDRFVCSDLNNSTVSRLTSELSARTIFTGLMTDVALTDSLIFDFNGSLVLASLGVRGLGENSIYCPANATGSLIFRNLNAACLEGFSILKCGCDLQNGYFMGAAVFDNCFEITIGKMTFSETLGSAVIVNVKNAMQLNIERSLFHGNIYGSNKPLYGGGVFVFMTVASVVNMTISNSVFSDNTASYGGSIAVITDSDSFFDTLPQLSVTNSTFNNCHALKDGGAYYQLGLINVTFFDCQFTSNNAQHFGGVASIIGRNAFPSTDENLCSRRMQQTFDSTTFELNSAFSFAVLHFSLPASLHNERLVLKSVTMNRNYIFPKVFDTDNCISYLSNIDTYISGESMFSDNYGSVFCLDFANLHFEEFITFFHNYAYRGGAVNIKGESQLYLYGDTMLIFSENSAVYGGSIFKGGLQMYHVGQTENCIFNLDNTRGNYSIEFQDNQAQLSGQSIFYFKPSMENHCFYQIDRNDKVKFNTDSKFQIGSSTTNISFSYPVYLNENNESTMDVSLGIYLTFNTTIYTLTTPNSALFYLTLLQNEEEYYGNESTISLNGQKTLYLFHGITRTNLYFTGENDLANLNLSLRFNLAEDYSTSHVIHLNIIPCKLGFEYDNKARKCVCVNSSRILCNERENVACIERGFWFGKGGIVLPCFSGYCKNSFDHCEACALEDGGGDFCKLQDSEQDECEDNHAELACVYCSGNHVYTYGAIRCVDSQKCDPRREIPIIVISSILFLLFTVGLLNLVLKLDNQLNIGYLYCFVYYYSVIGFILPAAIVNDTVAIVESLIQSAVQLNPVFLGQFDICFTQSSSLQSRPLYLTSLNYVFPTTISISIGLIILISKSFPKVIKFRDSAGVKATCLIILLSFTAILETSFDIINPVQYSVNDKSETFVSTDPKLKYFKLEHVFLWIIAILFMVLFILPFTLFLLFSPLLMRYVSLTKVKPLLDQFHACYKDEYRWMSGFYFLSRLLYFCIIIDPSSNDVVSYPYIRYLTIAVVIIHCLIQPYKTKILNVTDAVLLSDLAFLSLIHNTNDPYFFGISMDHIFRLRATITFILLYVPAGYLLILLLILLANKSSKTEKGQALKAKVVIWLGNIKQRLRKQKKRTLLEFDSEESLHLDIDFEAQNVDVNKCREPLISIVGQIGSATEAPPPPSDAVSSPPCKPKFSELMGSGNLSPGERQGSFCVRYVKFKENVEESDAEETVQVTGN